MSTDVTQPLGDGSAAPDPTTLPPLVEIVAGAPTAEEIAALVSLLATLSSEQQVVRRPGDSVSTAWNAPSRRMRPVVRRGYRAWRRNALPH